MGRQKQTLMQPQVKEAKECPQPPEAKGKEKFFPRVSRERVALLTA